VVYVNQTKVDQEVGLIALLSGLHTFQLAQPVCVLVSIQKWSQSVDFLAADASPMGLPTFGRQCTCS
jgi:hypothetical protein